MLSLINTITGWHTESGAMNGTWLALTEDVKHMYIYNLCPFVRRSLKVTEGHWWYCSTLLLTDMVES